MSINLENLLNSINKLEDAINVAEGRLTANKKTTKYTSRFDSYRRICDMQRRLSEEIFYLKSTNNNEEILRKVGLINGLSAMILDDIKNISIENDKSRRGNEDSGSIKYSVN